MIVHDTTLADVKLIEPRVFGDQRGFFLETWSASDFTKVGLDLAFVQDNHSRSAKGVLRGMHYQIRQTQGKLVRVVTGRVYDVALDLRRSSPTFGKWEGFMLSSENKHMLWVPPGFAHGFLCMEDNTDFVYKCTDYYSPQFERTILWSDPSVAIEWPIDDVEDLNVASKDQAGVLFEHADVFE